MSITGAEVQSRELFKGKIFVQPFYVLEISVKTQAEFGDIRKELAERVADSTSEHGRTQRVGPAHAPGQDQLEVSQVDEWAASHATFLPDCKIQQGINPTTASVSSKALLRIDHHHCPTLGHGDEEVV
jgi:hypothetical protein